MGDSPKHTQTTSTAMTSAATGTAATAEAASASAAEPHLSALESLPAELLLLILEQLPYTSLKRLQRVSKRLQAAVATPSRMLNKKLWRTPYSAGLLRNAAKRSKKRGTEPLQLHPILERLSMRKYIDDWNVVFITAPYTRCKRGAMKLSSLSEISHENATYPPIKNVVFDSRVKHYCLQRDSSTSEAEPNKARCTPVFNGSSIDGGPLTIKEFVEYFTQSLKGACAAYGGGVSAFWDDEDFGDASFEGWDVQRLKGKEEVAQFKKPNWVIPDSHDSECSFYEGSSDFGYDY